MPLAELAARRACWKNSKTWCVAFCKLCKSEVVPTESLWAILENIINKLTPGLSEEEVLNVCVYDAMVQKWRPG